MSKQRENLIDRTYGSLKVISHVPDKKDSSRAFRFWICECKCGRFVIVRGDNLKSGHSTQCLECAKKKRKRKGVVHYDLEREF